MKGMVTYFNKEKGYGFIESELEGDKGETYKESYFFHITELVGGTIGRYDVVEFDLKFESEKSFAIDIKVLEESNVPDFHRGSKEDKPDRSLEEEEEEEEGQLTEEIDVEELTVDENYTSFVNKIKLSDVLDTDNLSETVRNLKSVQLDVTHVNNSVINKTVMENDISLTESSRVIDNSPGTTDISNSRAYTILSLNYYENPLLNKFIVNDVDYKSVFHNVSHNKLEIVVISKFDSKHTHNKLINLYSHINDLVS